ncbi:ribosomal-protein-alanine N-acetyltransferase [Symmachiella dynata]|uniref:Ribosomal-protein-alanine N-acetyltransferase n=2 Tax=Symmachiella dynata TaxID=2527995 RepID=A0A517ZJA4_9PLAN|nr:ribosomal protein S18-alanine N-acetyltransferase [Symmachiella dynata]QDU42561.1 ribosomal-protein-alanine N-acetyltransferase [Symmachiella dynata]
MNSDSGQYHRQGIKSVSVKVQIRWMIRRDMAEVLRIERESFEYHWTEEDFLCCLRQRNCIGMVAEVDGQVVGFMIYELHKTRLHILNFAVADDFRRQAIGGQMIEKLVSKLSQQRRKEITLEVRETNLPAQLFFQNSDFVAVGVLRDHYEDSAEDAYVMKYRLDPEDAMYNFAPHNRIAKYEKLADGLHEES